MQCNSRQEEMEDEDDEDAGDGRGSLKEMGEASPSAQDTKRKVPDFNLSRRPGTEGRGHMGWGGVGWGVWRPNPET